MEAVVTAHSESARQVNVDDANGVAFDLSALVGRYVHIQVVGSAGYFGWAAEGATNASTLVTDDATGDLIPRGGKRIDDGATGAQPVVGRALPILMVKAVSGGTIAEVIVSPASEKVVSQ